MSACIIAYIPVLHEGYRRLLANHPETNICYVLGNSIIEQFPVLKKDIRRLDPQLAAFAIQSWPYIDARVVERGFMSTIRTYADSIIMPDEDISHELADIYFPGIAITYDSIFLRWDKKRSTTPTEVHYDRRVSRDSFLTPLLATIRTESEKSSDWWRRVGGALVRNETVISIGYNQHIPAHAPYRDGDPRMFFKAGTSVELTTADHAEAVLIGDTARRGIALEGADIYTTTFPCPMCANLIGRTGIQRCFFQDGYAALDAEVTLRRYGVEIILIE
jgi:dCMP deaminase